MHPFSRRSNSIVLLILAIALASCQKPPENYPVRKAAPGTAQLTVSAHVRSDGLEFGV